MGCPGCSAGAVPASTRAGCPPFPRRHSLGCGQGCCSFFLTLIPSPCSPGGLPVPPCHGELHPVLPAAHFPQAEIRLSTTGSPCFIRGARPSTGCTTKGSSSVQSSCWTCMFNTRGALLLASWLFIPWVMFVLAGISRPSAPSWTVTAPGPVQGTLGRVSPLCQARSASPWGQDLGISSR